MKSERRKLWLSALGLALLASAPARARDSSFEKDGSLVIFADTDDDDDDGVADDQDVRVAGAAATDLVPLPPGLPVAPLTSPIARLIAGSKVWNGPGKPRGALALQGVHAGTTTLEIGGAAIELSVVEAVLLDGRGAPVDLARSHAAVSRRLPSAGQNAESPESLDPDAMRWLLAGPLDALPENVTLTSTRPNGATIDAIRNLALEPIACPPGMPAELACRATPLGFAVADVIDRQRAVESQRWLQAEVGGRITLSSDGRKIASVRVGGPRVTAVGPIERFRARLRLHVFRTARGGMPAIGGDDAGARALARNEIDVASRLWGQCGIHFGDASTQEILVHDPPPVYMLAVGCEVGLPASGGEIRFSVAGRRVRVPTRAGQTPVEVASAVTRALGSLGVTASVSPNPATLGAPYGTADVIVRRSDGALAELHEDGTAPLSSDASLGACFGEVDFADGVEHFTDVDAPAPARHRKANLAAARGEADF
ncbi:MAG TPA: hypothetical protein VMI54_21225, partial [Polyangiaceae bacterium]|nr:hypothetical protein [Polyangiaceae bacterium]